MRPTARVVAGILRSCTGLLLMYLLSSCSGGSDGKTTLPSTPTTAVKYGLVQGGLAPVSGSSIQMYAVGTAGDGSPATALFSTSVTTDTAGKFDFADVYRCPSASSLVYMVATGGNPGLASGKLNPQLALMAVLGQCGHLTATTNVTINELTTVASVWSLAPYMSSPDAVGSGSSDTAGLVAAFALASELANTATGMVPGATVPVGTTVPVNQINTLADILSSCVDSVGGVAGDGSACGNLFQHAASPGEIAPTDVLRAALSIANNPTLNTAQLFALLPSPPPFQPILSVVPAGYTIPLTTQTGLSVSSTSLAFPAAYLSFATTQSVTLTNLGTAVADLSSISIVGAANGDFIEQNTCGRSLSGGVSCVVSLTFTPSVTGAEHATLQILSNAPNPLITIPLNAQGLADSAVSFTLSPTSLNFTQAGIPQTITMTNNGAGAVGIGSITATSTLSNLTETNTCGAALAAQASCAISVQIGSLGLTTGSGAVTVTAGVGSNVSTATVQVVEPGNSVNFSTNAVSFGDWARGVTSPVKTVTVNSGNMNSAAPPLSGSITGVNAADFSLPQDNCSSGTYQCQLTITFTPSGLGARTATLVTAYGNVVLNGTGITEGPSFTIAPYPAVTESLGVSSPTASLAVVNNGSVPLLLTKAGITGTAAGDFAVTNGCSNALSSSQSCTLSVLFTPTQLGMRIATFTLTDSTSGISNTATLSGIGVSTQPVITPNLLNFGVTQVGIASAAQTATVTAPNGDPVSVSAIPDGPGSEFSLSTGTCAMRTPCQISATFTPYGIGSQTSAYSVTDTITQKATTLTLQGTGGVSSLSISPTLLAFAATNVGATSVAQSLTLTNTGTVPLTIVGTALAGASPDAFAIAANTCSSVAAGASCVISVDFMPKIGGSLNAALQIASNAPNSPVSIPLSGTGIVINPLMVDAEWPFNDGTGTTVADITGNGHDGTFCASTATPSWGPDGIHFLNSTTSISPAQCVTTNVKTWTSISIAYEIYVGLPTTGTGGLGTPYNNFPSIFGTTITNSGVFIMSGCIGAGGFPANLGAFMPSIYKAGAANTSCGSDGFGQRHILTVVAGSPDAYYIDGQPITLALSGSSATAIPATGVYEFGSGPLGNNNGFRGTILYAAMSTSAWTPAQVIQENNYIQGKITQRPLTKWPVGTALLPQVILPGDSLWSGRFGTGVWTSVLSLNSPYVVINRGVSGINVYDVDRLAESTWLRDASPNAKTYILFDGGSNDIAGGASPENIWASYVSLAAKAKATGAIPIASTIISRSGYDANIAAANAIIRGRWKQAGYAALLDNWERPEFATGSYSDTTYYVGDGVHLTGGTSCTNATGSGLFCLGASKIINTLDGSTAAKPDISTSNVYVESDANNYIIQTPTASATHQLVDCSWITGMTKTVVNGSSSLSITMGTSASQTITGQNVVAPNSSAIFTAVPSGDNGGCYWVSH